MTQPHQRERKRRLAQRVTSPADARGRTVILERFRLDGKVALVTGGSQGLGLAMAETLAEVGADVAIIARRAAKLAEATARLERFGNRVLPIQADLSDVEAVIAAVDRVPAELGRLDILVTAAGTQLRKEALTVTPEDWDQVVSVNMKAVFFACQRAAHHMLALERAADGACRGKIINVASLTALSPWPNVCVYGMTKSGVVQMTKALALEWGPLGICVNAIGPGTFPTELTEPLYTDPERLEGMMARLPLGRPGRASDLAGATLLLSSEVSDYITGQVIWVDGGWLVG